VDNIKVRPRSGFFIYRIKNNNIRLAALQEIEALVALVNIAYRSIHD